MFSQFQVTLKKNPPLTPTTQTNQLKHVTLNTVSQLLILSTRTQKDNFTKFRTFVILGVVHCVEVLYTATTVAVVKSRSPQCRQVLHLLVFEETIQ